MAGALIHLLAALVTATVVYYMHFRFEFSMSIFMGNFFPDVLKIGFSAVSQGTINIFNVQKTGFYFAMNQITSSIQIWFSLLLFVIGLFLFLYQFHYIKKKQMKEYDELFVFLLVGVVIHLILDYFVIESNFWI